MHFDRKVKQRKKKLRERKERLKSFHWNSYTVAVVGVYSKSGTPATAIPLSLYNAPQKKPFHFVHVNKALACHPRPYLLKPLDTKSTVYFHFTASAGAGLHLRTPNLKYFAI